MIKEKLNSIELGDCVLEDDVRKPLIMSYRSNGIDFTYTEESRQLTYNVWFSSIVVSDAEIATVRVLSVNVSIRPATNAYVGAGSVFEVVRIDGNAAICKDPHDGITDNPLELPFPLCLI